MIQDRWYDKTPEETAEKLGSNLNSGLAQKNALGRLKKFGLNTIYPIPKGSFRTYLGHIVTDFTSILLIVTAAISAALEHNMTSAAMIIVLLINYAASIFTYVKAQRVLEGMGHFALPVAKVMRDGKLYLVRQEQLSVGDIIFVNAGDIVPCDARLCESEGLWALETSLTSAAHATEKDASFIDVHDIAPAAQKNMLFASSILTQGKGKAITVATGRHTLVSSLGKNQPIVSHDKLSVIAALKKYCSLWSLCMIAVIFVLTVLDLILGLRSRGIFDIFLTGLSLAVASMSELYMAFGYIIIACGIFNAMKRYHDVNSGALIKNSEKLAKLKDITCIVVPKEGIFTLRELSVERIWRGGIVYDESSPDFGTACEAVIKTAVISTGLYGAKKLTRNNISSDNIYTPEEDSIIRLAEKYSIYNISLDERYPIRDHEGIGEFSLFDTTLVETKDGYHIACRGDAAELLNRCDYYMINGRVMELDYEIRSNIKIAASLMTREAFKVVGTASGKTIYNNLVRINACQTGLIFEGFMAIREPILTGAAKSVSRLRAAGIKVIITCDDIGDNNRYFAEAVGIASNPTDIITGNEMKGMREGILRANVSTYKVYEGLNLTQKRMIIKYLRDDGEVVGVLGRELNEIILLSDGDIGFAQSLTISGKVGKGGVDISSSRKTPIYVKTSRDSAKSGCEALKFISDVIVSEGDSHGHGGFNAIVAAIQCSKVIFQNLLRMVKYLLISQCARFFIVLYSVISHEVLFTAPQILFSGLIFDFLAVLIIAFERPSIDILTQKENTEHSLNHPLITNLRALLFGLFWAAITVSAPKLFSLAGFSFASQDVIPYVFLSFTLTQIITLNEMMKEKSIFIPNIKLNRIYIAAVSGTAVFIGLAILIKPLGTLFGLTLITLPAWCAVLAIPLAMLTVYEIYKLITTRERGFSKEKPGKRI